MLRSSSSPVASGEAPSRLSSSTVVSDANLLKSAKQGDFSGFEQLVRRYHKRLLRLTLGMVGRPEEAEEVVQEVFLQAFRHLATVRDDLAVRPWLYRIAVNQALMRLRETRRAPVLSLSGVAQDPASDTQVWRQGAGQFYEAPDTTALRGEMGRDLATAIAKLPEKYRMVLWLRDVLEETNEEVANVLGLTLPTVKTRLHRARLWLRQILAEPMRSRLRSLRT